VTDRKAATDAVTTDSNTFFSAFRMCCENVAGAMPSEGGSDGQDQVRTFWTTASFLVTTILYVLIGAELDLAAFARYADLVAAAAVLVVVVRAVTVYAVVGATNLASWNRSRSTSSRSSN